MLEDNILYKIYQSGKIPVIRYKNDGFKNHCQDNFFSHNGVVEEKYKNINGCFCMLGGMQDSFILSGIEDTDILNIGYIEKDTKVYDLNKEKWVSAKSIFEEAINAYKAINEENKIPIRESLIDKHMDDFDLFYTQAIVKAEDITLVGSYNNIEQKQFLETIKDGFFGINSGLSYYYLFKKLNALDEFINFVDENKIFDELLKSLYKDDIAFSSPAVNDYLELIDLSKSTLTKTLIETLIPQVSTKYFKNKDKLKDFVKKYNKVDGLVMKDYAEVSFNSIYNNNPVTIYLKIQNNTLSINAYEKSKKKDIKIDLKTLLNNKIFVKDLSDNLNIIKQVSDFLPKYEILNTDLVNTINNINTFLTKNENIYIEDNNIIYQKDNFIIEYNFILDDSIILTDQTEKALHEEDVILDNKNILDIVYDFRRTVLENNGMLEEEIAL